MQLSRAQTPTHLAHKLTPSNQAIATHRMLPNPSQKRDARHMAMSDEIVTVAMSDEIVTVAPNK